MRKKSARLRHLQWLSVILLMAAGIVFVLDRSTLSIANHAVSSELHLSAVQMGLLLSAFSWAYAFTQLPMGVLLDSAGPRIVLAIGILLWGGTQIFTGFVSALSQFLGARFLLGVGEAPIFPAGAKMIAEWFNQRERGAPTGTFLASTTIGPVLAPPIITALLMNFGWRATYITLGLFGIALFAVWYFFVPSQGDRAALVEDHAYFDEAEQYTAAKLNLKNIRGLLSQRATWGMVLGFVGIIYMVWLYLTWLPAYLEHERHLSIRTVGWVLSIPYVFGTIGNVASGHIADHLFRHGMSAINSRKYLICAGLLGGAAFTVPVAYTPSAGMAIVYLCFVMLFLYIASAGAWALLNVVTPRSRIATVGSLQNFAGYFAGSLAPIMTGFLLQQTGSFKSALIMSSGIALISAILYFVLVKVRIAEAPADQPAPLRTRLGECDV